MNDKLLKNVYDEINKLKPVTLFESVSGSGGPVTLSDSAANYSAIEIFFHSSDNMYNNTGKIFNPNGKSVIIYATYNINDVLYNKQAYIQINTNQMSIHGQREFSAWAGNTTVNSGSYFYIDKVVGYK